MLIFRDRSIFDNLQRTWRFILVLNKAINTLRVNQRRVSFRFDTIFYTRQKFKHTRTSRSRSNKHLVRVRVNIPRAGGILVPTRTATRYLHKSRNAIEVAIALHACISPFSSRIVCRSRADGAGRLLPRVRESHCCFPREFRTIFYMFAFFFYFFP